LAGDKVNRSAALEGEAFMSDITARFSEIVGDHNLLTGDAIPDDYFHDEVLTTEPQKPAYVAKPATAEEVAQLLKAAAEHQVPVTARGSGTGLSGAATPRAGGLVISFERMNAILEVDTTNQVAVVQPGVTLTELDAATAGTGLRYMVHPGELSSSVGGNVGTNAGGMRAVKYGIARHNVLGLQAVLPTGEIIRTGGKIAKVSTGYDLTQLIVGSEGTLALATEVIVKLHPRLGHSAAVLAPFVDDAVVPRSAMPKFLSAARDLAATAGGAAGIRRIARDQGDREAIIVLAISSASWYGSGSFRLVSTTTVMCRFG
jgi:glycolate oxidase